MGTAVARAAKGSAAAGSIARADLRDALERTLAEADADERTAAALRAAGMRMRFAITDCGLVLDLWADDDGGLGWAFGGRDGFDPELELEMDADVVNRFLQGRISLPIAIARGRVRCRGSSVAALRYLPATRLLCAPYRRVVDAEFPALAR